MINELTKMLEQAKKMMEEQDRKFHQEIALIKDDKKRNKVVTLYNEMKASSEPFKYLSQFNTLLSECKDS